MGLTCSRRRAGGEEHEDNDEDKQEEPEEEEQGVQSNKEDGEWEKEKGEISPLSPTRRRTASDERPSSHGVCPNWGRSIARARVLGYTPQEVLCGDGSHNSEE